MTNVLFTHFEDKMQGNIVFLWAWWTWLSNLVGILHEIGYKNLIGIDDHESQITNQLKSKWIKIYSHWQYQIQPDDAIIYSSAMKDSPELQEAYRLKEENHKPLLIRDYFTFLGEMSKLFKTIGITGTNGKSSSTSMMVVTATKVLEDFWIGIVGALVPDLWNQSYWINQEAKSDFKNLFDYLFTWRKLNYDLVKKYYFIIEACEYLRHFLHLKMDYAIITSLELDHTDYYKDWEDYQSAFLQMLENVKENCFVLENLASEKVKSYEKIEIVPELSFDFKNIRGKHQEQNASLVFALLNFLTEGKKKKEIRSSLEDFHWIRRRMECLVTRENGTKVFSDYGHVASSIELGFQALKERFPGRKLIGIFQPHQIQRILAWRKDFPNAMQPYDSFYIYDIYAARENIEDFANEEIFKDFHLKTIEDLGNCFAEHCHATYLTTFEEIKKIIEKSDSDSIIAIYSAGDIDFKLRKYFEIV